MRVRPGVVSDASRIAQVRVLGWQAGYRGLLPQPLLDGLQPAQRVRRWIETLEQSDWPRRGTLVADGGPGTRVAGFTDLRPARDDDQDPAQVAEIASFYVLPALWRHGVGRQLMVASVDALRAAGYRAATLWVLEGNDRAVRFYLRMGWAADGAGKDDRVGGMAFRDLRYRRPLD